MNLDLLFFMFLFIYIFIYFLILTVFNYVCVSAFEQGHLDPWRSKSALIISIIITCLEPALYNLIKSQFAFVHFRYVFLLLFC